MFNNFNLHIKKNLLNLFFLLAFVSFCVGIISKTTMMLYYFNINVLRQVMRRVANRVKRKFQETIYLVMGRSIKIAFDRYPQEACW